MQISALCIPETGAKTQQSISHYVSTAIPARKGPFQFTYLDMDAEVGHFDRLCSSSIGGSPEDVISDRMYSGSATPSSESAPKSRPGVTQKRLATDIDDNNSDEECPDKKRRAVYEFACPFYKRNRLKEHLYRHHMHYVCERCSQTFKAPESLREHVRQSAACNLSEYGVPEDAGFDLQTEKKLRSRKKIDGQTEADKWAHMYQLLFSSGSAQYMPSPFVDYSLQEETYPPAEESEESLLYPAYLRLEAVECSNTNPAATLTAAVATENQAPAVDSRGMISDNMLAASLGHMTSRDRPGPASVSDEDSYGRQVVSRTDIYEMVRDQVRAVLSSSIQQPSPTHMVRRAL
ncbi:hypothetical protein SEPCBS119000_003625 [Sporothrix epigloea]|uniref:C2H2-type domain-containing protein n=1 Tax=Sporothrix epigloea TaxID=1892477 RepID=A0ABP0DRW3_9PEZI